MYIFVGKLTINYFRNRVSDEQNYSWQIIQRESGHSSLSPGGYIHHRHPLKQSQDQARGQHRLLLHPQETQLLLVQADSLHSRGQAGGDEGDLRQAPHLPGPVLSYHQVQTVKNLWSRQVCLAQTVSFCCC